MDYVVILEKGERSYGAYVPDIPGCVAVGATQDEAIRLIREAIELHLDGLLKAGASLPPQVSRSAVLHVDR